MTKVRIEFTGDIEIDAQGWGNDCKLDQVKTQAAREIDHWQFMVKKGTLEPIPVNFIKAKVTHVILDV